MLAWFGFGLLILALAWWLRDTRRGGVESASAAAEAANEPFVNVLTPQGEYYRLERTAQGLYRLLQTDAHGRPLATSPFQAPRDVFLQRLLGDGEPRKERLRPRRIRRMASRRDPASAVHWPQRQAA